MVCIKHKSNKDRKLSRQQKSCAAVSVRRFSISQDVTDASYIELVRFCARHSCVAVFVVTMQKSENNQCRDILRKIVSLGGEIETVQEWPGTIRYGKSFADKYTVQMSLEILSLIEESAKTLFSWLLPKLPEDLCFLRRDSSVLLYSTTHERFASVNMTENEYDEWKTNHVLSQIKLNPIK